jgi:3D (Asp-Asp-Asp) domain-containing protein
MQHSIHTPARLRRRHLRKRLSRRVLAAAAVAVAGVTGAAGLELAGTMGTASADGAGPGTVVATGGAKAFGSASGNAISGMSRTPSGGGYWLTSSRGAVFAFGDAPFLGSLPANTSKSVVDVATAPDGQGYWLVAADGGIFNFGSATFRGSAGDQPLNQPIVGMAATPTGEGYWLVARDGGIFTYGDAAFHGSLSNAAAGPVVDVAATPDGSGNWVVAGGRYLGDFELTCYALRGTTATGVPVRRTGIAVDPRVIPLGSEVYIAGEGTRQAIDTGGAIKGNRIDVWRPSAAECRDFGRQSMPVFTVN